MAEEHKETQKSKPAKWLGQVYVLDGRCWACVCGEGSRSKVIQYVCLGSEALVMPALRGETEILPAELEPLQRWALRQVLTEAMEEAVQNGAAEATRRSMVGAGFIGAIGNRAKNARQASTRERLPVRKAHQ